MRVLYVEDDPRDVADLRVVVDDQDSCHLSIRKVGIAPTWRHAWAQVATRGCRAFARTLILPQLRAYGKTGAMALQN